MAESEHAGNAAQQAPAFPVPVNVRQLTEAVITALTQWNATALDILSAQASTWVKDPPTPDSLADAIDQHRLLGALLEETERNLHMFRETSPCVEFYAATGTYDSHWR